MAADQAPQGTVAERQVAAPVSSEVQDFAPPSSTTWSDVASKCWNEDLKTCATSLGQKLSETFGSGSTEANQQLQREGKLPELTLIGGTDAKPDGTPKGDGTDALPKALQGDNKHRTETLMNSKADPQERLKAASELIGAGVTGFTMQGEDGSLNKVRLEKEKVGGDRSMLAVYVSNKNGAELNALRAIENGDGTLVHQKDSSGREVDFKNRGAALLDRLSEGGKVVDAGTGETKDRKSDTPIDKKRQGPIDQERSLDPERTGQEKRTDPERKERVRKQERERQDGKPEQERTLDPEKKPTPEKKTEPGKKRRDKDVDPPIEPGFKSPYERKYEEGDKFSGRTSVYWEDSQTASGVRFNKNEHTAASREFPFGTVLKVRNTENGEETRVVITDNGPFAGKKVDRPDGSEKINNRVLDISKGAADAIGMKDTTPRAMEITVESIPEGGAWGGARRNLDRQGKKDLLAQVKRVTEEGRS